MKSVLFLFLCLFFIAAQADDHHDDDEPIFVHIVPHSYNSEFMTMIDSYFPEQHEQLLQTHFDKVFEQVVRALTTDRDRTFTHYETMYFRNWYSHQSNATRQLVKDLVQKGNLEFVTGGYTDMDEACPTYGDMLVSLGEGQRFLWSEFGYWPRVAWSLDKSGHSQATARVLAESGIEALYVLNVDPEDRRQRLAKQDMQFVWRPLFSPLGRKA